MIKTNKVVKRVIGGAFVSVALITAFYQYQLTKVVKETKVTAIVAKSNINNGQQITLDSVDLVQVDKNFLVEGYIDVVEVLKGSVATKDIRVNEQISKDDYIDEASYEKLGLKVASIKGFDAGRDTFSAFTVKPYDKVDLLYFSGEGVYDGVPFLKDIILQDLVSAEDIHYDSRSGQFIPSYALFSLEEKYVYEIHKRQEAGGYFKIVPHSTN